MLKILVQTYSLLEVLQYLIWIFFMNDSLLRLSLPDKRKQSKLLSFNHKSIITFADCDKKSGFSLFAQSELFVYCSFCFGAGSYWFKLTNRSRLGTEEEKAVFGITQNRSFFCIL